MYHPWFILPGIINIGTGVDFFSFFIRIGINYIKSALIRAVSVLQCDTIELKEF